MRWQEVSHVQLQELAAAARDDHEQQEQAVPKPDWWELRLKGAGPRERAYWRANGWYRCQCGAERRAREARRTKNGEGKWVRVCGCCGSMCLTLWKPIEPPRPAGPGSRVAA